MKPSSPTFLPGRYSAGRSGRGKTVPSAWLAALLAGSAGCGGCRGAPEPGQTDAGATSGPSPTAPGAPTYDKEAWLARHPRDEAGRLIPKSTPPPIPSGEIPPTPKREPDWDLDPDDPARDYVRIYAIGTKRYGDSLDCVNLGRSSPGPSGRRVEATVAAGCADAGSVRDVFLVDVAADHLTIDGPALARWPDGSDPQGPPTKPVRQATSMRDWKSPLHVAITQAQLVPIRLQTYGRGTYPVITLAGWHGAIHPQASADQLKPLAQDLCKANADLPLAFFAGVDRSTTLLIRCPASVRWDKL